MNRTLIAAAYAPELEGLSSLCAGLIERDQVVTRAIGVGIVEASAGIERALAELSPSRVVLIGTAGCLPSSGLQLGQLVVVRRAHLVTREPEYLPALMKTRAEADAALAEAFSKALGAPLVEAVSTLGITLADSEAERLASQGPAQLEQLECYSVLAGAARHQVPATAVFALANHVGSMGAHEWRQNRAEAERAAVEAVARALGE
jgi:nucleoside phosphorylase